jgi:hypothetical protein
MQRPILRTASIGRSFSIPNHHTTPLLFARAQVSRRISTTPPSEPATPTPFYHGPLARTFKRLKLFSLSSLGLSAALTPFIFVIDSSLPTPARIALALTAIGTSGSSTALVGWCGAPYVSSMSRLSGAATAGRDGAIQMITNNMWLQGRKTSVFDPRFLKPTSRPFAKWELAKVVEVEYDNAMEGKEQVIAETTDNNGRVCGQWLVKWESSGAAAEPGTVPTSLVGHCRAEGRMVRYAHTTTLTLSACS